MSSCASDADLAWAREMINTWRPDLRIKEQVVNSTSEVWRRNSPHPYTDYKAVLSGGGKCGPRSSWSVMICQAFGIPAIGVGQPAHACVAYKVADPSVEPQPGSAWKVGYGRGWQVSHLEGMSGLEFLAGVEAAVARGPILAGRTPPLAGRGPGFQGTGRRGHGRGPQDPEVGAGREDRSHRLGEGGRGRKGTAARGQGRQSRRPCAARAVQACRPTATRIEATAFSGMSGVAILDCYTGGKQVNFQKSVKNSWVEYTLDVPAAGVYALQIKVATPNFGQVLDISAGSDKPATIEVPNTTGLWDMTPASGDQAGTGQADA